MGQSTGPDKLQVQEHAGRDPNVVVRAWLSKTAVWVGDRVTFNIELKCARGVDILVDDLAKDRIRLEGLEILDGLAEKVIDNKGDITHRFRFELASYDIGTPNPKIFDIPVRYYVKSPGQTSEDPIPSGEIVVAAALLAFRSTIPTEAGSYSVRDIRAYTELPDTFRWVQPVGLVFMAISVIPLILWSVALVQRQRQPKLARKGLRREHFSRSFLEQLRHLGAPNGWENREAYTRLDSILRGYLSDFSDVPAQSLTPLEIEAQLVKLGSRLPAKKVGSILKRCEHARYCPGDQIPGLEEWQEVLREVEKLLAEASK